MSFSRVQLVLVVLSGQSDFRRYALLEPHGKPDLESQLDRIVRFQNALIARATGSQFDGGSAAYRQVRQDLLGDPVLARLTPTFIRQCGDEAQFWAFIKYEKQTYQERRALIWDAFRPLIQHFESTERSGGDGTISQAVERFGAATIQATWLKALDRRAADPDGAITTARSLIESTCKHILDDAGISYRDEELPKLWALTAEQLNLLPAQHEHEAFKRILGNCQAVVDGLANVRNRVGDAHGRGRSPVVAKGLCCKNREA